MKIRKLISWISMWSFSILGFTGLVLYFTPHGRTANWADWRFLRLTKDDWGAIHVILSMLFLTTAIWHIYLNWKPLMNYIRNSSKKITFAKPEFLVSLILTLVFCLGAYFHVPPFGTALDGLESVKSHWEDKYGAPPWGHAELASLKSFCKKMNFDLDKGIAALQEAGYKDVSPMVLLRDLAAANDTSPKAVLELLKANAANTSPAAGEEPQVHEEVAPADGKPAPSGLGRLTLEQISEKAGVAVDTAIRRLEKKLHTKATADMKIKEIAEKTGETPMDIWAMIQEGE